MQYFLKNIRLYFHHQSHPPLGIVFLCLSLFIVSGLISPLFSSTILGMYQHREFIFQCLIFLPFHTVHGYLHIVPICTIHTRPSRTNTPKICYFHLRGLQSKSRKGERSYGGGGIGWGDHFIPHKFIKRSIEH